LQGLLATGLGAKIGTDTRGSSAIIVVSGTEEPSAIVLLYDC
jgi:hypothetical protein